MDGILNILKPPGMTSHDVVARMRRLSGQRKIGHSGTLDPGAAGVLPVFLGQATRLIEYGMEWDKVYRTELTLGGRSETGDDASLIIWDENPQYPTLEEVEKVLREFVGRQLQVPPMYSALKVDGKKLYELAREGKIVEREARPIEIYSINLLSYKAPVLRFDVACSKGTYIRTLCEDIAAKFSLSGVMTFLLRTRVGEFDISQSVLPAEEIDWQGKLMIPETAVAHLDVVHLSLPEALDFCMGRKVGNAGLDEDQIQIKSEGQFIGIGKRKENLLQAAKVLNDLRKE